MCPVSGEMLAADERFVSASVAAELDQLSTSAYCPRCGRSRRIETAYRRRPERAQPIGCRGCAKEVFWRFEEVVRIGAYEGALSELVVAGKYRRAPGSAREIARRLVPRVTARAWCNDLVALVPVPMHALRRWQRPSDHAFDLACGLGAQLGVPVRRWVRRTRYSASQVEAPSRTARFENVGKAFAGRVPNRWAGNQESAAVAIVDNVLTSGATVTEVARVLRGAGVRRLILIVAARAALGADQPKGVASEGPAASIGSE